MRLPEQHERHVVHGNALARAALGRALVRMSVKYGADVEPRRWLLEPPRAEPWKDLRRFALDRFSNWRIVHHCDAMSRLQPRERRLELQRLGHGLLGEPLDRLLAPRPERSASEAAAESLYARESDAPQLGGITSAQMHARVGENAVNLRRPAAFVIMVA